jgi:hypothetical protein
MCLRIKGRRMVIGGYDSGLAIIPKTVIEQVLSAPPPMR